MKNIAAASTWLLVPLGSFIWDVVNINVGASVTQTSLRLASIYIFTNLFQTLLECTGRCERDIIYVAQNDWLAFRKISDVRSVNDVALFENVTNHV